MKDKDHRCPYCKKKMKYKGSRRFYCKNCNKSFDFDRQFESRSNPLPGGVPDMQMMKSMFK